MKKFILFIVGFLYISPIWGQDILNLSTGQISANGNTSPIRIVNQYEDCIIVSYDFSFAKIIEDDLLPGTIWWHYDGLQRNCAENTCEIFRLYKKDRWGHSCSLPAARNEAELCRPRCKWYPGLQHGGR